MEQVILAFESEKTAARLKEIIESAGLGECLVCRSAAEAKRLVGEHNAILAVCGYKLRDETAEQLFEDLPRSCSMLVIAFQNMLDMIGTDEIFKLPAPATRSEITAAAGRLIQTGRRFEKYIRPMRSEEELSVIARAKMILMERRDMNEEQAHRYLQKISMDTGRKLLQTAQMVLDGTICG